MIRKWKIIVLSCAIAFSSFVNANAAKRYTPADAKALGIESESPGAREERLKRHEERIKTILEERRQKREEELRKKREEAAQKAEETKDFKGEKPLPDPRLNQATAKPVEPASAPAADISNKNYPILYFNPLDAEVKKGEVFVSWVKLFNEGSSVFDEMKLTISYDPGFLKPIKVYDSKIKQFLKEPAVFNIDKNAGLISYNALLSSPQSFRDEPIIKIAWEALKSTEYTEVNYVFEDENRNTGFYKDKKNILGNSNLKTDGVIPSSIRIVDENQKVTRKREGEYYEGFTEYTDSSNETSKATLEIVSPKKEFKQGETIEIGVKLNNPDSIAFDSLNLWIRFNPENLEAVDWDTKNWIKAGLNAYDGFARKQFPFDFHKKNLINNSKGEIDYQMGVSNRIVFPSGEFLKIKFKVKENCSTKDIFFERQKKGDKPNTMITRLGKNVLDKSTFKKYKEVVDTSQ